MKINRNMSAVLTNRQLLRTENKLTASMERLSSGYKINKPGDNPSGMAISNKMRAQIRALDQAEDNISDGISVMQIADGALNEATSILQRIRELSVQAANGTNSDTDKEAIQSEIDQLVSEVDRLSSNTEYNEKTLLDGSSDTRVYSDAKNISRTRISDQVDVGTYEITATKLGEKATYTVPDLRKTATLAAADAEIYINDKKVSISSTMSDNAYLEAIRTGAESAGCTVEGTFDAAGVLTDVKISSSHAGSSEEITFGYGEELATELGLTTTWQKNDETGVYSYTKVGSDAEISLGAGFTETTTWHAEGNRIYITDQGGFSMEFLMDEEKTTENDAFEVEVTDMGRMTLQVGANEYQTIAVRIPEISAESMYLDWVDVTVDGGPEDAMDILDGALSYLNEVRSKLGAYQNRLEYAQNSTATTNENMTEANSVLMDTDMAEEMSEYTQQNVLDQAAISVLAQANQLPQQILSLLS